MNRNKIAHNFIIITFVTLYVTVSLISTIHVIDFFRLSNPEWLAVSLAIAFEIGAAASLAALIVLHKMSKWLIWIVFFLLTAMQMMGNAYYAYSHLVDFKSWVELFGLVDEEVIYQKRILSIISGAILPLIALGFIKSLVDYIRPEPEQINEDIVENLNHTQLDEKHKELSIAEIASAPKVTKEKRKKQIKKETNKPISSVKPDITKPRKTRVRTKKIITQEESKPNPVEETNPIVDDRNPQVMPGVN